MQPQEQMTFDDPDPVEVPVKIGGKSYLLREASAGVARQWRNAATACSRDVHGDKVGRLEGVGNLQPLLVSLCLFELYEAGSNGTAEVKQRPVSLDQVLLWPDRMVRDLFERAKAVSHLDENQDAAKARAKNLPSAATAGS